MIRRRGACGPMAEVGCQGWGLMPAAGEAERQEIAGEDCNLQIGLHNAAIFRPRMTLHSHSKPLCDNSLQALLGSGSRVALNPGCLVQRRRVFGMLKALKAGGDKTNALGDPK